jgi:hypothetical protein
MEELRSTTRIRTPVRCRVNDPGGPTETKESKDASSLLASLERKLPAEKFARFVERAPKDRAQLWEMFIEYRKRHTGPNQYGYVEFADQLLAQPKP